LSVNKNISLILKLTANIACSNLFLTFDLSLSLNHIDARSQNLILDELIEPTTVLVWWHTRDQVLRSPLQRPLYKGFTLLVEVPLL